jgi:two-component system, NarL family, nitrate/nitrite response regulator NarL
MSSAAGSTRVARFGLSLANAKHRAARRENPAVPAVLIATADPALRGRWKGGLQEDYQLRDVSDRGGLERTMAALVPDVLLLDIDLLAASGIGDESFIRGLARDTKVVVHSACPNEQEGIRVLKAGAKGYCRKDVDPQVLCKIVDRVYDGEIWAERKLIPRLLEEYTSHPEERPEGLPKVADGRLDLLTPREREIASLIGAGASNKEIASRLRVGEGTVKAHLTATFRKLGFSDRLQLGLFLVSPNFVSKRPVAAEDAPAATPIERLGS